MRLLVSVANAAEASAALAGGADVIDAKNPLTGALGAVTPETLIDIHTQVAGRRPVTAALGDAIDEGAIEHSARRFAALGAALVKVGFAGIRGAERVKELAAAAVRGAKTGGHGHIGVVLVAYADADRAGSVSPNVLVNVAARAGAEGLLLDTADKAGPGLRGLVAPAALTAWVADAHAAGLFVALAGKLIAADLPFVRDAGADVAGVRGAACDGGRTGCVSADKVRLLRALCGEHIVRGLPDFKPSALSAAQSPHPPPQSPA